MVQRVLRWVCGSLLLAVGARAQAQTWTAAATLRRPGTPADQTFGYTLAVNRNAIMVAATSETGAVGSAGALYVFSGPDWSDVARIEPTNVGEFEGFGRFLSLDGDQALVSNGWIDRAKVWFYEKVNGVWTEKQRVQEVASEAFGFRLILRGDLALIGAPKDAGDSGKIHVYERAQGVWAETEEVTASDAMASDFFSYGMDYDGQRLAVGASGNLLFPTRTGVYTYTRSGNSFVEDGRLVGPEPMEISFGAVVAVSGDTLVVCAPPGRDRTNNGKAFVYAREAQGWVETQQITMPEEEQFPWGASLQNGTLWLTARTGMTWSAIAYRLMNGLWTEVQRITVPIAMQTPPTLAVAAGTVAVGIPYDGAQGSVQVFRNPAEDPPTGAGGGGGSSAAGGSGGAGQMTGDPGGSGDASGGCACLFAGDAPPLSIALIAACAVLVVTARRRQSTPSGSAGPRHH